MLKKGSAGEEGLIFLDICIAVFLFGSILAMLSGYSVISLAQRNSEAELGAVCLANEQIARLENKGNAFLLAQSSCDWLGDELTKSKNNNLEYKVETSITSDESGNDLRRIIVKVSWRDDGLAGERSIERILYAPNY